MGSAGSKQSTEEAMRLTGHRPFIRLRRRQRIVKTLSTISSEEHLIITGTAGSLRDYASSPSHSLVDSLEKMEDRSPPIAAAAEADAATARSLEKKEESTTSSKTEEDSASRKDIGADESSESPRKESGGREREMVSPDSSHEKEEEDEEKKNEEEEEEEEIGYMLGLADLPGSPSFREYCRFSFPVSEESSEDAKDRLIDADLSEAKGSGDSRTSAATSPAKKSLPSIWERFRRLRMLIRGPVAVSHLLNMRSCYNQSSTAADNRCLLSVKPIS